MMELAEFAVQAAALVAAAYVLAAVIVAAGRAAGRVLNRIRRSHPYGFGADAEYREFRSNVLAAFEGGRNRMVYVTDEQFDWAMRMVRAGDVRWAPPLGGQPAIMLPIGWTGGVDAPRAPEPKKPDLDRKQFLDALRRSNSYWAREPIHVFAALTGTPAEMWADCPRGDVMLAAASWAGVDRRRLVATACACARSALRYVPEGEDRPKTAIRTAEAWARGDPGVTVESVRMAARAAESATAESVGSGAPGAQAATCAIAAAAWAALAAIPPPAAAAHVCAYVAEAADAAARAADAGPDARVASLAASADLVRSHIPWAVVEAALRKEALA